MQQRPLAHLAGIAALVIAVVAGMAALLPLAPTMMSDALDVSFAATLHFVAGAHDATIRLISTYGPLGFVYYDLYDPGTYAWLLTLQGVLAAAICGSLVWIGWTALGSVWGAVLLCAGCTPFLAPPDVRLLAVPLLALWLELSRPPAPLPLRALLGAALAIAALVKFTAFLAVLLVLGSLTLHFLMARRRIPVVTWSAVAVGVAAWVTTGLGWSDLVAYLGWSLGEITPGYASAMQLGVDVALTCDAIAVTAVMFAAGTVVVRRRWGAASTPALAALAGVLFLIFKAGFVRADVHVFTTAFALLVVGQLMAISLPLGRRPQIVAAAVIVGAPAILLAHAVRTTGWPSGAFRAVLPADALARVLYVPKLARGDLRSAYAVRLAALKAEKAVPSLQGPIDIYPTHQVIVLAHALQFRPRPVFQSYMAYTPALARANAEALDGPRAPQWILFRPETIDNRFPALDDAPSWPLLLTRYRPVGMTCGFALLERRSRAADWTLQRLGEMRAITEQSIAVPSAIDGPIWARIIVEQTVADRLSAILLRGTLFEIALTLTTGETRLYRFIPAMARDGFLLSPVIARSEDFSHLMGTPTSDGAPPMVASLQIVAHAPIGSTPPRRNIAVEFFRLQTTEGGGGETPSGVP